MRILATFVLHDGSRLSGHIRPAAENWADVVPPPTIIGAKVLQGTTPRARWGISPLAIVEQHQPFVFVKAKSFRFWCLTKNPEAVRDAFYKALKKLPDEIFPMRYEGIPGLSAGIVSGELNGFCAPTYKQGKPPSLIR